MRLPRPSLTQWIFIGMGIGLTVGWLTPDVAITLRPLSTIFLRLIKSIIAPLIFATLVVGIAGHGNLKQVGRMGFKSIIYFEIVTTLALLIGLVAVNLIKPGVGVHLPPPDHVTDIVAKKQTIAEVITHIVPQSFIQAAAEGEVLQIVVFTLIFSFALAMIPTEKRQVMLSFCDSLAETMFKFTGIVMRYAPIGVGAAIAVTVGSKGLSVLINLGLLILTMYIALIIFIVFVLGSVALVARIPVKKFIAAVEEPALIAFSTTSSEAALPKAMEVMERLGVPRRIVAFVIPTGYSFNLDGSTLYLSLAAIFVAQAAGVELTIMQQVLMMLTLMLTSKGVAGVPRSSLVILAGTLSSFGLPLEGVAVILGVDEILDMGRTTVNVVGNCLASAVIAKWEGEFQPNRAAIETIPANN
ncbi:MAG: cation:dicarboxylase symporter family transporter [Ignavibacteria bacterium]|nr:cation:dicarboxylase symporter family transporter [Ignavibacteria bacterium]MBI3766710.1 cation:dicarboxylase symporter family transporter [Ignavibacteriales bacterium]